jgi:predicted DNA-binding protein with PD1-like motif
MSNGAETRNLPQPTFPLQTPGTAVVHAGPPQHPRIVSVPTRFTEHIIDLTEGTDVFAALEQALADFAVEGLTAEFVSGQFGHIAFVHPAYGPDAEHPMSFTEAFTVDCPTRLAHAAATVGFRDGTPFCHIHASWTQDDGTIKGGHLLPGTLAGPEGLRVRVFALPDARLISDVDAETGFSAFAPHPAEPASPSPTAAPTPSESDRLTPGPPDAVVSRIRPGEILDEAVLAVCRSAGFDSAEVTASLGSTTGAVFVDGSAPWPAVEFTHLIGTVTGAISTGAISTSATSLGSSPAGAQDAAPQVVLTGEVVDVAGQVAGGTLEPGANPVAVTFELFVRHTA